MKSRLRVIGSLLGWAVALGLAAPGSLSVAGDPVSIGLLLPMDENSSADTFAMQSGVVLAARLVHEAGGVSLRVIHRDSGHEVRTMLAAARKLISTDGVSAIIGPLTSEEAIELTAEVAVPLRVLIISPSAAAPDISALRDDDLFFRTIPSDIFQGAVLAAAAKERGGGKIGVLYADTIDGRGLAKSFRKAVESSGEEILSFVPFISGQTSFRTEVERVFEVPFDILMVAALPRDGQTILRQVAETGRPVRLLLPGTLKDPRIISAGGPGAPDGTWGTAFSPPDTRLAQRFRETYRSLSGEPDDNPLLATSFDAAVLVALAATRVRAMGGRIDGPALRDSLRVVANPPGAKVDFSSLARAISLLAAGEDIDYEGISGPVDFDDHGDISQGSYAVWTVEGGSLKKVRQENLGP